MWQKQSKIAVYVTIAGKLPKKRKAQNFEIRLPDGVEQHLIDAVATTTALEFIEKHKIRYASAYYAGWGVSESTFTDSDGHEQTMVFRNMFPSSNSVEINLN